MNPSTASTETPLDAMALRDSFSVEIFTPADEGWDNARLAWNLAVDQHPAAVALPTSAADVVDAVAYARREGLRICVQGTGHNASAYGPLGDSLLIKTERMREVSIDAEARIARVDAGVIWGEVVAAAAEHGLVALAGSSHDVGVVGYTLGGGVSWLARKHGLACERVTAIELVDAAGELRRLTATEGADLFWALRGGGGNFGVVTALEFSLLSIGEVYAGSLFFPFERAGEVLECWRRWTESAPDEITSVGRMLQFPPIPEIPEPVRGQSFVVVEATYLGTEEHGRELLTPLRELGPIMDTFAMIAPADLLALHMDPPGPVPGQGDHQMLADLDAASLAAAVEAVGPGSGSPLLSYEFRHIGGALGRRAPGTTGRTLRILGEVRRERGINNLRSAVEHLERSPMKLDLAKALLSLGTAERAAGDPAGARDPLRRAFELAEVCGAAALASRARTELYASGSRPRTSAQKGPGALTASEKRVAGPVADGQTNKQIAQALFVTPKTVEVHLSKAYRKLEISSRRELSGALSE